MQFDVFIIGGGAAGLSCALVLGSAMSKPYAAGKKVALVSHQKTSHLASALLNNALGVAPGTSGKEILNNGIQHLKELYPQVQQIEKEKVTRLGFVKGGFKVITNKNSYFSRNVVLATGYAQPFTIEGLEAFVVAHKKSKPSKGRIQLENSDHLVSPGLYVAGSLAGHRSQYAIACGSGAAVATDLLTDWNQGEHTKVHDKLK